MLVMSTQATNVEIIESDRFEANGENMTVTTKKRSMLKAISWRFIATITGALIVYFLTGEFEDAGKFIVLDVILKLLFYYGHERAWSVVEWGHEEKPAVESA